MAATGYIYKTAIAIIGQLSLDLNNMEIISWFEYTLG
jgi:hypothetical protein